MQLTSRLSIQWGKFELVRNFLIFKDSFVFCRILFVNYRFNFLGTDTSQQFEDDITFDDIISPNAVRDHKKSIDEQFESLLMDDNNNNQDFKDQEVFKHGRFKTASLKYIFTIFFSFR